MRAKKEEVEKDKMVVEDEVSGDAGNGDIENNKSKEGTLEKFDETHRSKGSS